MVQSDLSKSSKEYDDYITTKLAAPLGFDSQKKTYAVWDKSGSRCERSYTQTR
jgi:hypothetical protein